MTRQAPSARRARERDPDGARAALSEPGFRLAWTASLISNTGSWLQQIAVPVVIYEMTGRTLWLGVAWFAAIFSGAFTTVIGGSLADRYDRRRILVVTNSIQCLGALTMWALWVTGNARIGALLTVLVVVGLASGVGVTTWQSIQPLLVPRNLVASAVRMNSTQYAVSRAIGPAIGTLVLREWGAAVCFASNAGTFLVVVVAMLVVRTRAQPPARPGAKLGAELREGWRYTRSDRSLSFPPVAILLVSGIAVTWTALAAAVVSEHFGRPARDAGILVTAYGVGSVVTGLLAGRLSRLARRSQLSGVAMVIAAVSLAVTASTTITAVGVVGMLLLGTAHILTSITLNTSIQLHAREEMRGRVMGLYLQASFIGNGLGALANAKLADTIGVRGAMLIGSVLLALPLLLGLRGGLRALDGDTVVMGGPGAGSAVESGTVPGAGSGGPAARPGRRARAGARAAD